jgi:hypothetical protein
VEIDKGLSAGRGCNPLSFDELGPGTCGERQGERKTKSKGMNGKSFDFHGRFNFRIFWRPGSRIYYPGRWAAQSVTESIEMVPLCQSPLHAVRWLPRQAVSECRCKNGVSML